MSGFTHSLVRVPFLALIIQNVLALNEELDWKRGLRDLLRGGGGDCGGCWRWLVVVAAAEVVGLSGGWFFGCGSCCSGTSGNCVV